MDTLGNVTADYLKQFLQIEHGAPIVCLCGSTRFKDAFVEANRILTLNGHIVLAPGVFGHSGDAITDEQKQMLDMLHFEKVAMADWICVINVDGYIGTSTTREMKMAHTMGKPIFCINEGEWIV